MHDSTPGELELSGRGRLLHLEHVLDFDDASATLRMLGIGCCGRFFDLGGGGLGVVYLGGCLEFLIL